MTRKIFIMFLYITFFFGGFSREVCAKDFNQEEIQNKVNIYYNDFFERSDLEELDGELNQIAFHNGKENTVSFTEIYQLLLQGKVEKAIIHSIDGIYISLTEEISENRDILIKLFILVIVAAIFNNYSSVFKFSYVGEQGFYITYLMIAVLLMQSFTLAYEIAEETIIYLKEIMEILLPSFFMSVTLCSGFTTSQMVNSMFFGMLTFVEKILLNIILPFVRIYFLIVLLNQINTKDRFSKLAGLLKQGIQFVLKSIVTGIIGLNVMKGMLVPVYENAKYNLIQKGISVIPGGNTISGLSTILLGAGVLIKNSIGITAVIVLLVLGSVPLLKLFLFYIIYRLILALMQPISDQRILFGIQGTADSIGILLRATSTSIILSVLSIAIILLITNIKLYTG